MKRIAFLFALILALGGCSLFSGSGDETADWSAQKLYTNAKEAMGDGDYTKAVKYFETLEARYPYGKYAQQAQLDVAYAYFKDNEPASAIAACDRFIKLHPNHPSVDYAYYLKGLVNFNEDTGFLSALGKQDLSERDPKAAKESYEAFRELTTHFPDSKYTPDGLARMKYLSNALAGHEIHAARYYMKRGAYVAAVKRAKYTLENFPQAPSTEDALGILVWSYDAMGVNDLRDDARRVLEKNFPKSDWLKGVVDRDKGWWKFW
jgi:outer membrane protein assembly factor BamD